MRHLVVIPARGGSKGVPGKNIKMLNGKPLIQYTIDSARELFEDNQIVVSTDCRKIKAVVESLGLQVPFLRPESLARDNSGTHEVLMHAIEFKEELGEFPEVVVLLQPTSPFRKSEHIKGALDLFHPSLDMIVSVKETNSNPYFLLKEEDEEGFLRNSKEGGFETRQDCPQVWELNGAIYVINISSIKEQKINQFRKVKKYVMDEFSSLDIDTPLDWKIAELYFKNH